MALTFGSKKRSLIPSLYILQADLRNQNCSHLLPMRWEEGTILIGQHLSLPPEYSENLTEPVTIRHSLAPFSQQERRLWCVRWVEEELWTELVDQFCKWLRGTIKWLTAGLVLIYLGFQGVRSDSKQLRALSKCTNVKEKACMQFTWPDCTHSQ